MAQTSPSADPFAHIVDRWFDAVETLLTAQRSWLKASLDSPLVPLYPIIPPMVQPTTNDRVATSA